MYYGNQGTASVSNGATTFDFFDGFTDDEVSSSWTQHPGNGIISQEYGRLNLSTNGVQCDWDASTNNGVYVYTEIPENIPIDKDYEI